MTEALWTADEVKAATHGTCSGAWQVSGISIDSRTVHKGDLFIALGGDNFDGHDYVSKALDAGASGALVSKPSNDSVDKSKLITVADTQQALEALAVASRARMKGKVAGITGSVGKTSSRAMLDRALAAAGSTHATIGNLNNHIGMPLTLARMPCDTEYAVIEMGMNHAGEITPLTKMARPHAALVTAIAPAHIEFFDSLEGIAHAKAEIFAGIEPGGHAVINRDTPHSDVLRREAKNAGALVLTFGEDPAADARLVTHEVKGWGARITADIFGVRVHYHLAHPGRFHALNSLGILATATLLGVLPDTAAAQLSHWQPESGRGEHMTLELGDKTLTLIDDSYNASPTSMRGALEVLADMPGRRVALLGDMLELGEDGPALHEALAEDIHRLGIESVHTTGVLMAHLHVKLPDSIASTHWPKADTMLEGLPEFLEDGDVLLVKGSHGSHMYKVAEGLKTAASSSSQAQDMTHVL